MTALSPVIKKLIARLASDHDGEVIATRNAISRQLIANGCDWHDLAASIDQRSDALHYGENDQGLSFGDLARACRDLDRGLLSPRERTFILQMCRLGFSRQPSPRQLGWLASIFARLQRRAAA